MPVVAVVNRKGGSGKSTLATHLAAASALAGRRVMLGDVDRQQSAQVWLKLRAAQALPSTGAIAGWVVDPKNVLRVPAGITHVVLDTPGGMRGFELARIVMNADAILMPVCNSVFDRDSAAECYAELKTLPRVASGRCKVAAIGMRLDARTRAAEVLARWAGDLGLPFIGFLREAQVYVRCVEHGLTLFDLPAAQVQADLAQWQPIQQWLEPVIDPPAAAPTAPRTAAVVAQAATARAAAGVIPDSLLHRPASTLQPRAPEPVARRPLAPESARIDQPVRLPSLPTGRAVQETAMRPLPSTLQRAPGTAAPVASAGFAAAPVVATAPEGALARAASRPESARAADGVPPVLPTPPAPKPQPRDARGSGKESARQAPVLARSEPAFRGAVASRLGKLLEALPIPRFLQRDS